MHTNLLIIDNQDSFTYNLVELVRKTRTDFTVIRVNDLIPEQADRFSHILISPGPDVPDAYPPLFELLTLFHPHKPILGVCLGHQTLCQFFGAKLYNLNQVRHGYTATLTCQQHNRLFQGLPPQFQVGLYHSWAVSPDDFPPALTITAQCEKGIIMAVEHRHLPIYGVQFHPESYISAYGEQILCSFLEQTAT